jgi:hypothetical protein
MEQLRSEYGGERPMLRPLFLSLILPALAVPAMARDAKQDVEKLAAAYQQCVNKHDPEMKVRMLTAASSQKRARRIHPAGGETALVTDRDRVVIEFGPSARRA